MASDDSLEGALRQLKEAANRLNAVKYPPPKTGDAYLLDLTLSRFCNVIAARSFSIALLLENRDDGALTLSRPHRELCIDLRLVCSWRPPIDAAARANIFERLRFKRLASRNPDVGANPTINEMYADLDALSRHYPEHYNAVKKLDLVRDHWSGLKPEHRLGKADIQEPVAQKIQDLLSLEVHNGLLLSAQKRAFTTEQAIYTAGYTLRWVQVAAERLPSTL
jgi:hypothetical protein